ERRLQRAALHPRSPRHRAPIYARLRRGDPFLQDAQGGNDQDLAKVLAARRQQGAGGNLGMAHALYSERALPAGRRLSIDFTGYGGEESQSGPGERERLCRSSLRERIGGLGLHQEPVRKIKRSRRKSVMREKSVRVRGLKENQPHFADRRILL